jgi:hypothetical protein
VLEWHRRHFLNSTEPRPTILPIQSVPPNPQRNPPAAGTSQVLQHHGHVHRSPESRLPSLSLPSEDLQSTSRVRHSHAWPSLTDGSNFSATWKQRASVLILLFGDNNGNLQVVLTTRSMKLRTHAGDVALPGGTTLSI